MNAIFDLTDTSCQIQAFARSCFYISHRVNGPFGNNMSPLRPGFHDAV